MEKILLVIRVCDENGNLIKKENFFEQYCFPALMSNKFIYVKYEYADSQKSGEQYLVVKRSDAIEYRKCWGEIPSREVFVTKLNDKLFSTKFKQFYIPGVKENYGIPIHGELNRMNKKFQRTQIPSKPIHAKCQ